MENNNFPYVYPYSREEADRLGELESWQESRKTNIACKEAIEEAIRLGHDGFFLDADCAEGVIADYGYKRVSWVLSYTIQLTDDGRFSRGNKDWAAQTFIPPENGSPNKYEFAVNSHPAVLDGFVNQYRKAFQSLGMFDRTHCLPDTSKQDFEGKVIVMSPDFLKESCFTPQDQLWLCTGGFGAHANSRGRAVFATNLGDGETARLNREDFLGVLADSHLPDWAREKLEQLQEQTQTTQEAPGMGGMTMR